MRTRSSASGDAALRISPTTAAGAAQIALARTAGDYAAFAAGYLADLRQSPLAHTLARLRLLAPTINMIIKGESSTPHAHEARVRMRYWRGEHNPPAWTPY